MILGMLWNPWARGDDRRTRRLRGRSRPQPSRRRFLHFERFESRELLAVGLQIGDLPALLGRPGDAVHALVRSTSDSGGVLAADFKIQYDTSRLTIAATAGDIKLGQYAKNAGFALGASNVLPDLGLVLVSTFGTNPLPSGTSGDFLDLAFHVKDDAPEGTASLTFVLGGPGEPGTRLNEGAIVIAPVVDGSIAVAAVGPGDTSPPTADIVDVTPDPRNTPVSSIPIVFSEAVTGLELADLSLRRDGGENLLTDAQTLSTSDQIVWVLENLSGLTGAAGTYDLELRAAGSDIRDGAGNELAAAAIEQFLVFVGHPWQNPHDPLDVNDDRHIAPLDVLLVINALNSTGAGPLPIPPSVPGEPPPFLDTSGDDYLTPLDALLVINFLNQAAELAAGEAWPSPPGERVAADAVPVYGGERRGMLNQDADRAPPTSDGETPFALASSRQLLRTSPDRVGAGPWSLRKAERLRFESLAETQPLTVDPLTVDPLKPSC